MTQMSEYGRIGSADPATHERSQSLLSPPTVGVRCAGDLTVAELLAWAKTKPADERYRYDNPNNCALCQFLRETGRAQSPGVMPHVAGFQDFGYWEDEANRPIHNPYPAELEPALGDVPRQNWTFGALVTRLEKLAPETIVPPSEWTKLDTYMNDLVMS